MKITKVKAFSGSFIDQEINRWLHSEKPDIQEITQSSNGNYATVLVWYNSTNPNHPHLN